MPKNLINCLFCGKERVVKLAHIKRRWGKYCSQSCAAKVNKNFTGHHHSEETKLKIRLKKLGVPSTSNTKFGSKENHSNWKGGITPFNKQQRDFFRYRVVPKVLLRDNYICQLCGQRGNSLTVDHIKKWSEYPNLRFELNNCRTLCKKCHYFISWNRSMPEGSEWGRKW